VAFTTGEIKMTSDGTPWRPLVHALDIAQAIACVLDAPRDVVHNETFNVGDTAQNYQVKEIADTVAGVFTDCTVSFGDSGADNRSYRVSFEKINSRLPGFRCEWSAQRGAEQLYDVFTSVDLSEDDFFSRRYTRLQQLEFLIRTGQVDTSLFWTKG
jgi:nucleoside-diphosphate-sugar epimerase